jgi:mono/diheme cytochrome c family protein
VAAGDASTESLPDGMPFRGPGVTTVGMRGETADTRTVTIVLPHDEPTFPDGPGQRQFLTSCVVCHSPRYISMQPPFPQHVWAGEVHKMVTAYGAHVTPEEEAEIVTYIMTIRGADTADHSNNAAHGGGEQP